MCKRLIEEIENEKIIVIVRGVERNKLIPIAEAMYRGGIKFLEITYSANGEVSDEETKENIRHFSYDNSINKTAGYCTLKNSSKPLISGSDTILYPGFISPFKVLYLVFET